MSERLSDKLDETNKLLKQMLEGAKLPGEKKVRFPKLSRAKAKKGYILYFLLRNNNTLDVRKLPIVSGNVYLKDNETFSLAETDYIGMYKKTPFILQPEWSNEPITKEVLLRKIDENKSIIKPQKQIIHLMEDAALAEMQKPKKSFKGILIIGLILLGIFFAGKQTNWFGFGGG